MMRPIDGPWPLPTEEEIENRISELGKKATRIIATDLVVTSPTPQPTRFQVSCAGTVCSTRIPNPDGQSSTLEEYTTVEATTFGAQNKTRYLTTRQGVHLRETTGPDPEFMIEDFEGLGGWLKYGVFSADWSTFTNGARWVGAGSAGVVSGTNPIGSATWTGAMIGWELSDEIPLIGDATLTFDLAQLNLDVDFTNIGSLRRAERRTYDNITWRDVPVRQDGFFEVGRVGLDLLRGLFYGGNHEEVAGVFERRNMVGAFGANRE